MLWSFAVFAKPVSLSACEASAASAIASCHSQQGNLRKLMALILALGEVSTITLVLSFLRAI
jgi:F0F1-type ATP synthase membrane subunit c/vacuolar-type H+-ATPase subunit K